MLIVSMNIKYKNWFSPIPEETIKELDDTIMQMVEHINQKVNIHD